MNEISSNLRKIADRIDEYRDSEGQFPHPQSAKSIEQSEPILDFGAIAEQIYKARRRRDEVFGVPGLFSDPALDILLDLLINEGRLIRVSVTSACIASCVPPTTALRWVATLEEYGFVTRQQDAADARRTFVMLTKLGRKKICDAISAGVENPSLTNPTKPRVIGL